MRKTKPKQTTRDILTIVDSKPYDDTVFVDLPVRWAEEFVYQFDNTIRYMHQYMTETVLKPKSLANRWRSRRAVTYLKQAVQKAVGPIQPRNRKLLMLVVDNVTKSAPQMLSTLDIDCDIVANKLGGNTAAARAATAVFLRELSEGIDTAVHDASIAFNIVRTSATKILMDIAISANNID